MILAEVPVWLSDLRGVGETIVAIVAAVAALWKFVFKPFLERIERERNEDFDRRLEARIHPVEDKVAQLKTITETQHASNTSRLDRFSDALTAQRVQLGQVQGAIDQQTKSNTTLIEQQRLLHADVRAHMEAEDNR